MTTTEILNEACSAKASLAVLSSERKNAALLAMADALINAEEDILTNNRMDIEAARYEISKVMVDRLLLSHDRIADMAEGIREVASLPDPVGVVEEERVLPNGLSVKRVSVPMGVVAMIYESRPNVTSDAAALSLKSGNVCVLRCGKEAHYSAMAIIKAMRAGLASVGLPVTYINILEDTSRADAEELMTAVGKVDLLIPRGGAGLIRSCVEKAKVPCIQTGTGICHVYVDRDADYEKALNIIENAKTSRPSVCNAEEVCLVARSTAAAFLPQLKKRLVDDRISEGKVPVELRLDQEAGGIISGTPAGDADFDTEFLDYILAVRVVEDVREAVAHIAAHSTHHSDAIVTENKDTADQFIGAVDSAAVYVNASTRFTDGGQFGLGCEIGISTQKLHARGPMGLREMTSYKYVIVGCGQVR